MSDLDDVRSDLLPGESVAWEGRPGVRINALDLGMGLVGVFLLLLFLFLPLLATSDPGPNQKDSSDAPVVAVVFLGFLWLLLIAMAVFYIIGPYLIRKRRARRTMCVLTNRRAITITRRRSKTVDAVFLKDVPILNKRTRDDGSGSIAFGNVRSWAVASGGVAFGWHPAGVATVVVFSEIPDVEAVAATAERLRHAALDTRQAGPGN